MHKQNGNHNIAACGEKEYQCMQAFNGIKVLEIGKLDTIIDTIDAVLLKEPSYEYYFINPITSIPDEDTSTPEDVIYIDKKLISKKNWSTLYKENQDPTVAEKNNAVYYCKPCRTLW